MTNFAELRNIAIKNEIEETQEERVRDGTRAQEAISLPESSMSSRAYDIRTTTPRRKGKARSKSLSCRVWGILKSLGGCWRGESDNG